MNTAAAAVTTSAPAATSAPQTATQPGAEGGASTPDADFLAALMAMIAPPAAPATNALPSAPADDADKADSDVSEDLTQALTGACPVEQILPILVTQSNAAAATAAATTSDPLNQCESDSQTSSLSLSESLQRSRAVRSSQSADWFAAGQAAASGSDASPESDAPSTALATAVDVSALAAVVADTQSQAPATTTTATNPTPALQNPVQQATVAAAPVIQDPQPAPRLHQQVGTARWADELGTRISLMAARGQQNGSLSLSPEHLGPLEVRISVSQDTANVWFGAQHADTRAALQEALPRLRELFAASGLSLGQANVSHEAPRQNSKGFDSPGAGGGIDGESTVTELRATVSRRLAAGLIDTYA
jgi:flagellar hook-length control protein FliK